MKTRLTLKKKYDKLEIFTKNEDGQITLFEKPQFLLIRDTYFFENIRQLKDHQMSIIDKQINHHNLPDILSKDRFIGRYSYFTFIIYTNSATPTMREICEAIQDKIYDKCHKIYVDYEKNVMLDSNNNYVPFIKKYCFLLHIICVDNRFSLRRVY